MNRKQINPLGLALGLALLYGTLNWLTLGLTLPGSAAVVAIRPQVVIPLLGGFLLGPVHGFIIGFAGNLLGDWLGGFGFVYWSFSLGNGVLGGMMGLPRFWGIRRMETVGQLSILLLLIVIGNVVGIGIGMILYNLCGGDSIHVLTWRFFHPIIVCNVIISYILILPLLVLFRKVSSTFDIRLGGSLLYLLIALVLLLIVVLSYSDSRAIHATFAELLSEEELQRLAAEAALANFRHGGSLGIAAILVGVGMAFVLIQYLLRPIRMLMQAARELKEGRLDQIRLGDLTHKRDELGQLAQVFDEAVARVREREAQLKHVIEKLRLEINTEQETQQVREITETEYFQSLRERSHALRARKADRPHEETPDQSGSESTD